MLPARVQHRNAWRRTTVTGNVACPPLQVPLRDLPPIVLQAVEVLTTAAVDVGRLYTTKLLSGLLLEITVRSEGQRTEDKPSRWRHGIDFK